MHKIRGPKSPQVTYLRLTVFKIIVIFFPHEQNGPQLIIQRDVFSIPGVSEEEIQDIYGRIGIYKALELDGNPDKALKLAAKIRNMIHKQI